MATPDRILVMSDAAEVRPTADVSVRIAWADDADAMGRLQVEAWRQAYAGVLPDDVLSTLDSDQFAVRWRESIARPREARQRVLVALERATVRGFAATAPSTDGDANPATDGEVAELLVDPTHHGAGHGSRLLHAVVDTLQSDKFSRATMWLTSTDDQLRTFLVDQGWAADGAHRALDLYGDGSVVVKQIRLHTDVTPQAD
jgi:GNAT superfamily N-acetyltransferase